MKTAYLKGNRTVFNSEDGFVWVDLTTSATLWSFQESDKTTHAVMRTRNGQDFLIQSGKIQKLLTARESMQLAAEAGATKEQMEDWYGQEEMAEY